jgi:hypothetical protein
MKTEHDALGAVENEFGRAKHENGTDALGTAQNESGSATHEKGSKRPQYPQKQVRERKTRKRELMPSVTPKTSPEAQNMKTVPDALGTAENDSGRAKLENETRRPRYRRKRFRERKT